MKKLSKKQVVILAVAVLVVIAIVVIITIVVKNRPNTKTSFEGEKGTQSVELDKVEFSNITKKKIIKPKIILYFLSLSIKYSPLI